MDHAQRVALAEEIAQQLLAAHGSDLLAVAAWGSVAQEADTPFSDLELWAVTAGDQPARDAYRVCRGIAVQLSLSGAERALAEAATVDQFWPFNAAKWRDYLGLVERHDFFTRLRLATGDPPAEAFLRALREKMRRLHEVGGKLQSSHLRGDHYGLLKAGRDLTHGTAIVIGLVNRRHYPNTRDLYPLSLQMPRQPEGYAHLLDAAGGFTTSDPEQVYRAATVLWERVQAFARDAGIDWHDREFALR